MEQDIKQLQRKEALKRLKILQMKYGLMETVINEFDKNNTLYYSEYINQAQQGILYWVSNREDLTNAINKVEEKYQILVYHAILVPTIYGNTFSLLYVSPYQQEWKNDREELQEGLPCAYVVNLDDDSCSEFGGIQITGANGGISRIA